jgi:hypothetical protein
MARPALVLGAAALLGMLAPAAPSVGDNFGWQAAVQLGGSSSSPPASPPYSSSSSSLPTSASLPKADGVASVSDSTRSLVYAFGGYSYGIDGVYSRNDLWRFDASTALWTQLHPLLDATLGTVPRPRHLGCLLHEQPDSEASRDGGRLWIFGGRYKPMLDRDTVDLGLVWSYALPPPPTATPVVSAAAAGGPWVRLHAAGKLGAAGSAGPTPPSRSAMGCALRKVGPSRTGVAVRNGTSSSYSSSAPSSSQPDPLLLFIFGGVTRSGDVLDDLWVIHLQSATWVRITPAMGGGDPSALWPVPSSAALFRVQPAKPPPSFGAAVRYSAAHDAILLHGGRSPGVSGMTSNAAVLSATYALVLGVVDGTSTVVAANANATAAGAASSSLMPSFVAGSWTGSVRAAWAPVPFAGYAPPRAFSTSIWWDGALCLVGGLDYVGSYGERLTGSVHCLQGVGDLLSHWGLRSRVRLPAPLNSSGRLLGRGSAADEDEGELAASTAAADRSRTRSLQPQPFPLPSASASPAPAPSWCELSKSVQVEGGRPSLRQRTVGGLLVRQHPASSAAIVLFGGGISYSDLQQDSWYAVLPPFSFRGAWPLSQSPDAESDTLMISYIAYASALVAVSAIIIIILVRRMKAHREGRREGQRQLQHSEDIGGEGGEAPGQEESDAQRGVHPAVLAALPTVRYAKARLGESAAGAGASAEADRVAIKRAAAAVPGAGRHETASVDGDADAAGRRRGEGIPAPETGAVVSSSGAGAVADAPVSDSDVVVHLGAEVVVAAAPSTPAPASMEGLAAAAPGLPTLDRDYAGPSGSVGRVEVPSRRDDSRGADRARRRQDSVSVLAVMGEEDESESVVSASASASASSFAPHLAGGGSASVAGTPGEGGLRGTRGPADGGTWLGSEESDCSVSGVGSTSATGAESRRGGDANSRVAVIVSDRRREGEGEWGDARDNDDDAESLASSSAWSAHYGSSHSAHANAGSDGAGRRREPREPAASGDGGRRAGTSSLAASLPPLPALLQPRNWLALGSSPSAGGDGRRGREPGGAADSAMGGDDWTTADDGGGPPSSSSSSTASTASATHPQWPRRPAAARGPEGDSDDSAEGGDRGLRGAVRALSLLRRTLQQQQQQHQWRQAEDWVTGVPPPPAMAAAAAPAPPAGALARSAQRGRIPLHHRGGGGGAPLVAFDAEAQSSCPVCLLDYEDGDELLVLPCRHRYHAQCVRTWLADHRVCPLCKDDVVEAAGGV